MKQSTLHGLREWFLALIRVKVNLHRVLDAGAAPET